MPHVLPFPLPAELAMKKSRATQSFCITGSPRTVVYIDHRPAVRHEIVTDRKGKRWRYIGLCRHNASVKCSPLDDPSKVVGFSFGDFNMYIRIDDGQVRDVMTPL